MTESLNVDQEKLHQLRLKAGLTQEHLAKQAGLSMRTIGRMEQGGSVRLKSLMRVAVALDVPAAELGVKWDCKISVEPGSGEYLMRAARELELLTENDAFDLRQHFADHAFRYEDFVAEVTRRNLLTTYQTDLLLRGEWNRFYRGDFKVLNLLGSGTFGRVYRATGRRSRRECALKVLRKKYAEDDEAREQFIRNARRYMSFAHPNLVSIFHVDSGATPFMAMQLIAGEDLLGYLQLRKKLEVSHALSLASDLASGLDYLFERGVTHGNLRPKNILVSSDNRALICGYQLSSSDVDDVQPTSRERSYAGLERASGVEKRDKRSDIFFLGCQLYHMLTGTRPLAVSTDRRAMLASQRYRDIEPITNLDRSLPRAVTTLVDKALRVDPVFRYQTPLEFLIDMRNAMNNFRQ